MDISINKPFKELLHEHVDSYVEEKEDTGKEAWSVGDRRVMTTICISCVWDQFCLQSYHLVISSFLNLRLSLHPKGHENQELNIKRLSTRGLEIEDGQEQVEASDTWEYERTLKTASNESEAVEYEITGWPAMPITEPLDQLLFVLYLGVVMGKGVQLFFTCFELCVVLVCIATIAFFRKEEKEFLIEKVK